MKSPVGQKAAATTERIVIARGRFSSDLRNQVLELNAQSLTAEEIALRIGRSPAAVSNVLSAQNSTPQVANLIELDEVIQFLSELPEEALQEVIQLARIQQKQTRLRQSLEARLRKSA
jgi:hypothetical protein